MWTQSRSEKQEWLMLKYGWWYQYIMRNQKMKNYMVLSRNWKAASQATIAVSGWCNTMGLIFFKNLIYIIISDPCQILVRSMSEPCQILFRSLSDSCQILIIFSGSIFKDLWIQNSCSNQFYFMNGKAKLIQITSTFILSSIYINLLPCQHITAQLYNTYEENVPWITIVSKNISKVTFLCP